MEEISLVYNAGDFIVYAFSKLSALYELDKYTNYIIDVLKLVESNMFYDCSDFCGGLSCDFLELKKNWYRRKKNNVFNVVFLWMV